MQPFDVSLNSRANGFVPQTGPVISSYTQPPGVFYVQQAPQDNTNKMAQREQLVQSYKNQASSFGRYCAMVFSILSVLAGGIIAYGMFNSDYWSYAQDLGEYASEFSDGADLLGDLVKDLSFVGDTISDEVDSCITFSTCIQICGYLAIGFAIYHGLTSFLTCCMTKQGGCVIFLIISEVVILIGSGVLANEISNNDCNALISDLVGASESILNALGTSTPELEGIEFPTSTVTFCIVFAVTSLFNAITFCCWNSNINQARKDEQELALKIAMIS